MPELYLQAYEAIAAARARLESFEPLLQERLEKAKAENVHGLQLATLEKAVTRNWQITFEAHSLQAKVKSDCVMATYVSGIGKLEGNGRELLEDVVACSDEAYHLLKRIDAKPWDGNWPGLRQAYFPRLFNTWACAAYLMHIDAFNRTKSASILADLQEDITSKLSEADMLRILDYGRDAHRWGMETAKVLDTASEDGIKLANDEFRSDLVARNNYLLRGVLKIDEYLCRRGNL